MVFEPQNLQKNESGEHYEEDPIGQRRFALGSPEAARYSLRMMTSMLPDCDPEEGIRARTVIMPVV